MNEQKLREALRIAVNYIDMDALYIVAGIDHDAIKEAIATTEPEPTGMPELPEADVLFEDGKDQYGYTEYGHAFSFQRTKAYGEQCWKAGYKHGAWGDKPAVNQQLTTEPFDELEAFEKVFPTPSHCQRCGDGYAATSYNAWEAHNHIERWKGWQARAAKAQVSDINVVESFTNDTKDAERYRWLRDIAPTLGNRAPHVTQYPGQSFDKTTYLDATKVGLDAAIDAAMAEGVKG